MAHSSLYRSAQAEVERFYRHVLGKDPQLVTSEARMAVETDLPEAIGFIRSLTVKMDKLINAILTDAVKQAADMVTLTNNEDGIAAALEKLL